MNTRLGYGTGLDGSAIGGEDMSWENLESPWHPGRPFPDPVITDSSV